MPGIKEPRSNQKLKILYLMKILLEETDESHDLTLNEIMEKLKLYGITAERKSLYSDLEILETYGLDISKVQYDRNTHYSVLSRDIELVELKLLVDAVQASKFITKKKSDELIKKMEKLTSKHGANKLRRHVNVSGRVKSMNEKIYYSLDSIHEAIAGNNQIEFQYFKWNVNREMELAHDGKIYRVSPWSLCWDDEKYYLIAYDSEAGKIKHFRVDKMVKTSVLLHEKRKGRDNFENIRISDYTNRLFGMFEGEVEKVELRCPNEMANVIIDRFGNEVRIIPGDDGYFAAKVDVAVTQLFIGWVMALQGVTITGPQTVVNKVKKQLQEQIEKYK